MNKSESSLILGWISLSLSPFLKLRYLTNLVESYRTSLRHWSAPSSLHSGFLCVDLNVHCTASEPGTEHKHGAQESPTDQCICWLNPVSILLIESPVWTKDKTLLDWARPPSPFQSFFRTAPLTNVCFILAQIKHCWFWDDHTSWASLASNCPSF